MPGGAVDDGERLVLGRSRAFVSHTHDSLGIFYVIASVFGVIAGVFGHAMNGEEHGVEPGMVAVTKPGGEVIQRTLSEEPVKALLIWVPGGESDRLASAEEWMLINRRAAFGSGLANGKRA